MSIEKIVADFETQLSTSIAIGGTSFSISSVLDDDGETIPNGVYCFTIDNGTSAKEYLKGTMTGGSVTSVVSISRQGESSVGAVRAHRVGASVIITDFVALKRIADMISGAEALDSSSPLIYDDEPTLSDGKELATVQYVLDVVNGGTVFFSSQTVNGVAGETLASPNIAYYKESDQRFWKSDVDDTATFVDVHVAIMQSSAIAGGDVTVQLSGIAGGFTSLTPGAKYYLSSTAGGVTATPTNMFIGWAWSTTQILMAPRALYMPTADQKAALAGSSGTPSSSNKYATEASLALKADIKFGGTGADGALTTTSGNTNVDLGGARFFVKNYSSISITGTGSVTFTNPHAEGTFILIKCSGNCTLTSSATPMLSAAGCGAAGAASYNQSGGGGGAIGNETDGNNGNLDINNLQTKKGLHATDSANGSGIGIATDTFQPTVQNVFRQYAYRYQTMFVGAGGGTGGGTSGGAYNISVQAAGYGGGALALEVAGAWNFTTANGISVAGTNGGGVTINSGAQVAMGGSGAGAGGSFVATVGSITANTGTVNVTGGTGGNAACVSPTNQARGGGSGSALVAGNAGTNTTTNGVKTGGDGAVGLSYGVNLNTEFV